MRSGIAGSEQRDYGIRNSSGYSTVEAQSTIVASRLVELPESLSGTFRHTLQRSSDVHTNTQLTSS